MGSSRTFSSSSLESSNHSALSSLTQPQYEPSTDLSLGLGITTSQGNIPHLSNQQIGEEALEEDGDECNNTTLYVKVYMEGIPIGRKLDLFSHDGYHDLIRTLEYMFNTPIFWAEADKVHSEEVCHHVLTYEDKEGDWMIVGDVPWEMFLSTVMRLKITRTDKFC